MSQACKDTKPNEITPAMIDAGVDVLLAFSPRAFLAVSEDYMTAADLVVPIVRASFESRIEQQFSRCTQ